MADTTTADMALDLRPDPLPPILFAVAIFTSAALVFVVQPMAAKLVLPLLGGSPSVWNTSMVFFQTALLAGYGYAHALQKLSSIRTQVWVHLALLVAAALFLPLRINDLFGEPDTSRPIIWLLGTLAVSVGAPFAILSATAPLLQAWFARVRAGRPDGQNPYVLYAASNLGSFLALLSYPIIIEPLSTLTGQRIGWSLGYAAFIAMVIALAFLVISRRGPQAAPVAVEKGAPIPRKEKGILVFFAAIPSSLMLGVTTHLSTDVASAPFLWVIPLALYLLTFVIAFQNKPWIPLPVTLVLASAALAVAVSAVAFRTSYWPAAFAVNILTFFFVALCCHQRLAERRPAPGRLTEFYLLLSLGGVVGGAFTALLAPVIFNQVWEYPLVLVLAGLARPWGRGPLTPAQTAVLIPAVILCGIPPLFAIWLRADPNAWAWFSESVPFSEVQLAQVLYAGAAMCAVLTRQRALTYTAVLIAIAVSAQYMGRGYTNGLVERSFFGVMRVAHTDDPRLGGRVHVLMHGTTLHGAQAQDARFNCRPTLYYDTRTPIGQAAGIVETRGPAANIGVIGQGSGAMATYKREQDRMTFFEIDPAVDHISRDPSQFSFISHCAAGPIRTVMGDARLTLAKEPAGSYDLLIIDAFSSDAVPTHLLTKEAIRMYLGKLKPNGVVLLHLSNRNLDIILPAISAARELGAPALHSLYVKSDADPDMAVASTEAIVISPTEEGLADFRGQPLWQDTPQTDVRPWTDDYVNLFGALVRNFRPRPERPGVTLEG